MTYLFLLPLLLITMPAYPWGIGVVLIEYIIIILLGKRLKGIIILTKRPVITIKAVILEIVITGLLAVNFCSRWSGSSKAIALAEKIHIPLSYILDIAAFLLFIGAVLSLDIMLSNLAKLLEFLSQKKMTKIFLVFSTFCMLILGEVLLIDFSSLGTWDYIIHRRISLWILNVVILLFVNEVVHLFIKRWKTTFLITISLYGIWSLINHYVILYHGSPFYPSEVKNFRTAAAVMKGYQLGIDSISLQIIGIIIVLLSITIYLPEYCYSRMEKIRTRLLEIFVSSVLIASGFYILLYLHADISGWSWENSIRVYGVPVCILSDAYELVHSLNVPEGYSSDTIPSFEAVDTSGFAKETKPDIILILNESFCDLSVYQEFETDIDVFQSLDSIDGLVKGYAFVQGTGGGTNNSEFELLTSHSMDLVNVNAPFNIIDFSKMKSHAVTYLEELGFTTYAMHCEVGSNYNRDVAYPAMGFDHVILGRDSYTYNQNGVRKWLDADNYADMISREEEDMDTPKFMYLLTFQNHGGYDQNEDSLDTVHVKGDLDSLTSEVNEYLSSLKLSVDAFKELVDYYKESERPVVICMVGDHAPAFITELAGKGFSDNRERELALKTTPYLVWSNTNWKTDRFTDYTSITDLFPLVVDSIGMPLSPYYQQILTVHEQIPARSCGICMDKDKKIWTYGENPDKDALLKEYYYMEYNALKAGNEYREDIFSVAND